MEEPGDRRPASVAAPAASVSTTGRGTERWAWSHSLGASVVLALVVALATAALWALLRGILELGPSLLAVAALGGWAIGRLMRAASGPMPLAMAIAAAAWLLGLIGTWLVSMALLQGSSRTFAERLEATPFLDWMSPQFGLLELAGLALYIVAAAYGARTP